MRRLARHALAVRLGPPPREVHVRPGRDFAAIANSLDAPTALILEAGTYHVFEPIVLAVECILWARRDAVIRRTVPSALPILQLTAAGSILWGLVIDDDAGGGGHAIHVSGANGCEIRDCYVHAGPGGGVLVGDGIHAQNSDDVLALGNRVDHDATRPNADIWWDDPSDRGRILGNGTGAAGVISYLGVSATVAAANIPGVIVR